MKPRILVAIVVVALVAQWQQSHGPAVLPDRPLLRPIWAVATYPVNDPGYVNGPTFRAALEKKVGTDHWRTVESNAQFNDDQPEFKNLMADPDRKSERWLTIGNGNRITASKPLPDTEAEALKVLGK